MTLSAERWGEMVIAEAACRRRANFAREGVAAVAVGINSLACNSLWQVRSDAWSSLEESSCQLSLACAQQRRAEPLTETVSGLLDTLGPVERFWAFPGRRRSSSSGGRSRPPSTSGSPLALREDLRRWRRPDDPYSYDIVVVPSFDDAVMAARLNFRLQACVIRRRFVHHSRYDLSSLGQFEDVAASDDLMEQSPDDRAQALARSLAKVRPELDLYLMTEIAVEDLAGRLSHHFRRNFHTRVG